MATWVLRRRGQVEIWTVAIWSFFALAVIVIGAIQKASEKGSQAQAKPQTAADWGKQQAGLDSVSKEVDRQRIAQAEMNMRMTENDISRAAHDANVDLQLKDHQRTLDDIRAGNSRIEWYLFTVTLGFIISQIKRVLDVVNRFSGKQGT